MCRLVADVLGRSDDSEVMSDATEEEAAGGVLEAERSDVRCRLGEGTALPGNAPSGIATTDRSGGDERRGNSLVRK